MSTGLMSCVRENSPPLEMAGSESGALSLPNNVTDQQKRRRFNPLRNFRRIFRRRTLAGVDTAITASSPSSPSLHSSSSPTVITSGPAQRSELNISPVVDVRTMSSAAYPPHLISLAGNRDVGSCGLTILPPFKGSASASGGFYGKGAREYSENSTYKGKEVINQDLSDDNREMTDYQRSLSEGRLVDSDYNRDVLSQSHDSVFSESATASSLSSVLKAELFDVLRKRRNRPDASDEDLGLPRSPTTPQRKHTINQSEMSSLSLLSMASSELDEELMSSYGMVEKINSTISSKHSLEGSRSSDEIDLDLSTGSRLSHSAARHKMAVRPKKKGPSRHKKSIEATVLPSTPEVNEDLFKLSSFDLKDIYPEKTKSHSLPPGVNAKILEQHSTKSVKEISINIKRSKTETCSISSASVNKNIKKQILSHVEKDQQSCSSSTSSIERKDDESSFFNRFLHRNSKRSKKSLDGIDDASRNDTISTEQSHFSEKTEHFVDVQRKMEETHIETKKESTFEIKSGLTALINSMMVPSGHERTLEPPIVPKHHKPKSGPAARQRILPKDLSASPLLDIKTIDHSSPSAQFIENEKLIAKGHNPPLERSLVMSIVNKPVKAYTDLDKINYTEDVGKPEPLGLVKLSNSPVEVTNIESIKSSKENEGKEKPIIHEHYEKKERVQSKIVGLSSFQQKVFRTEALPEQKKCTEKQRKVVEKSKSFRYYSEGGDGTEEKNLKKHDNMPSLPDLSHSHRTSAESDFLNMQRQNEKNISMAFEINDNNLIKLRRYEEPQPLTQGIYTKNIILSSAKSTSVCCKQSTTCNPNITEIEENIDKLVKSPFITILKSGEASETKTISNVSTTIIRKAGTYECEELGDSTDKTKVISSELSCKKEQNAEFSKDVHLEQKISDTADTTKTENKPCKMGDELSVSDSEKTLELADVVKVERRFKLDLSDNKTKEVIINTATTPPPLTPSKSRRTSSIFEKSEESKVPEFMKIQLNRVDSSRPKSNVVLAKNVKDPEERDLTRRFSNENVEITDTKPPLPPENSVNKRSSITSVTKLQEDVLKSPIKKVDEENNILRNSENTKPNQISADRRKSVNDEKQKYEKKLEDLKTEKRKSATDLIENRRSVEDENGVILRKKSFAAINQSSKKEDTPELMKVFARRSLKIKDPDDMQQFEETEKTTTNSSMKKTGNLDSDKENQSSSEEKLDKLPKIEITIQPQKSSIQNGLGQKNDVDKIRTSTNDLYRKPTNVLTTTAKPFVAPIRYTSVTNYRNISTVFSEAAKKTITPIISNSLTATIEQAITSTADGNEQNNNNKTNIRHTIGGMTVTTKPIDNREDNEFKGILQRRAEWEKRAKEALK